MRGTFTLKVHCRAFWTTVALEIATVHKTRPRTAHQRGISSLSCSSINSGDITVHGIDTTAQCADSVL
jgi:hypothetical protein